SRSGRRSRPVASSSGSSTSRARHDLDAIWAGAMIMLIIGITLLLGGGITSGLWQQLKLDHKTAKTALLGLPVREQALDLIQSMQKLSQQSLQESQKLLNEAIKAGRDHALPSAELVSLAEPHLRRIAELDSTFLDRRDALHAALTREQWS